ncbi:hypothetical protein PoB_003295500 [Plakobranchus ocellatus]|uniref:Uncharacterized protein n=1 Tax=Plakobranchus ocellatus TaxID=259542 RepID=A0AAV4AI41_9GAST|nr:hypothetical protein PoB_003295500 [Plakobranchus ocellatus]
MIGQPCSYLSSDHLGRAGPDSRVAGERGEMRTLPLIASYSLGKVGSNEELQTKLHQPLSQHILRRLNPRVIGKAATATMATEAGFLSILAHLETRDT